MKGLVIDKCKYVAFVLLKAFHFPAATESKTALMHPSLHSFFLTSLCGWLELKKFGNSLFAKVLLLFVLLHSLFLWLTGVLYRITNARSFSVR